MVKKGLPGYVLGLMFLLPSAMLMVACWMCPCLCLWKRWRGKESSMLKGDGVTRVRQNVSVEFSIPEQVVGFVIGRKGSSVKQVEAESGARVQFKEQKGSTDKVVVISGRPSCVQAAQDLIQQAVDEKLTSNQNQQMLTVTIPRKAVGRIIGRHGANIRSLQRESGAKITMIDGSRSDSVRTCEVIGTPEQLTRAVALIQEVVAQSEHRGSSAPPRSDETLDNPTEIPHLTLPSTSEYIPVFVSSIDGVGGVWVQPIADEDPANLESLVEDMTEYYSNLQGLTGTHSNVEVGDVFAAPFEHDSSWYRVRVTSVSGSNCELLYLDYGDYGTMGVSMLRELRPEYFRLRCQSMRCVLDSVLPTGGVWSEAALQCLEETTHSAAWKVLMIRVLSREGIPKVQIIDTSTDKDIDIADKLVSSGHAHWANPHPPYPHSLRYRRDGENPMYSSSKHVPFPCTSESVFVSSVLNPDLVFVQPEGHQLALSQLCERLNAIYSNSTEQLKAVKPGQLVAACFPHDNQWYRGQVVSFNSSDNSALLMYPDYGLMFCLPVQHLRPLRSELYDIVFYALPCSLSEIQPSGTCDWPEGSSQFLRDVTKPGEWQVMYAKLSGYHSNKDGFSLATITLRSPDETVSVNSQLVDTCLAEYKSRLSPEGGEECVDSEGVKQRNIRFKWAGAGDVTIAGSFTDWKEVKLEKRSDGGFETSVDIPQGSHEYKFLVDGAWQHDDCQPTAINSFGTFNNTLSL